MSLSWVKKLKRLWFIPITPVIRPVSFFFFSFFFWSQFGDEGVSSVFYVVLAWTCLQSHFAIVRNKSLLSALRLMSLKYQTVGTWNSNCRKKILWYKLKWYGLLLCVPLYSLFQAFLPPSYFCPICSRVIWTSWHARQCKYHFGKSLYI